MSSGSLCKLSTTNGLFYVFFLMIRRPPRSTLFPTRRSSDLGLVRVKLGAGNAADLRVDQREAAPHLNQLGAGRSEEHTSELQSRLHLVCRLLLEKKKKKKTNSIYTHKQTTHTSKPRSPASQP